MKVMLSASAKETEPLTAEALLRDAQNICLSAGCQSKQYGNELVLFGGSELAERLRLLTTRDKASTVLISLRAVAVEAGERVKIEYAPSSNSSRRIAGLLLSGLGRKYGLTVERAAETELMMVTVYGVPVVTVEYEVSPSMLGTRRRGKQTGQLGWILATLLKKAVKENGGS